jgi:hypothetical protein
MTKKLEGSPRVNMAIFSTTMLPVQQLLLRIQTVAGIRG